MRPIWDVPNNWIDPQLRSLCDQQVAISGAGITASLSEGEGIRAEIFAKFRIPALLSGLEAGRLSIICVMTDPAKEFALTLTRRQSRKLEHLPTEFQSRHPNSKEITCPVKSTSS